MVCILLIIVILIWINWVQGVVRNFVYDFGF